MNKTALTSIVTACVALAIPGSALGAPKVDGEFPLTNMPNHLTQGPDGNIWVAEGNIAKITPAGVVTEFSPGDISGASGITTGPDGNLWVTQNGGVAKFSPANPNGATKFAVGAISNANQLDHRARRQPVDRQRRQGHQDPAGQPGGGDRQDDHGHGLPRHRQQRRTPVGGQPLGQGHRQRHDRLQHDHASCGKGRPQEVAAGPGGQVAYTDPGQAPHEVGRLTQGAAR